MIVTTPLFIIAAGDAANYPKKDEHRETLTRIGEHRFREEDEIESVLIDLPEGIKVVE